MAFTWTPLPTLPHSLTRTLTFVVNNLDLCHSATPFHYFLYN